MDKIDLSIIIVDYKSKKYLFDCLKSIKENLKELEYEIIIVDVNKEQKFLLQNSEISKILDTKYLILHIENKGFGTACNFGSQKASGEYLLFLNPDTLLIDDSINKMYEFITLHKKVGALTCLLYNDKECKKIQKYFFGNFQSIGSLTIRRYNYKKIDRSKEFFYTDIVTGACLMIKKELFDKIRGFDQKIFMYLEDDDLCKRLVDLGYKNAVLNTAKIVHLEGQSLNNTEKKRYYYKSQNYYWQKYNGYIPTLIMRVLRWPYKLIKTKI